jgi:hypothetical protein
MPLIFWTYTDEGKLDPHSQYQTGSIRGSHFRIAYLQVVPRFSFKRGERFFLGRGIGKFSQWENSHIPYVSIAS